VIVEATNAPATSTLAAAIEAMIFFMFLLLDRMSHRKDAGRLCEDPELGLRRW
jgi:hypothetical protein